MKRLLAGLLCLWAFPAFATTAIAPNNAGLWYSPAVWNIGSTDAFAVNSGARMRTLALTTTTAVLNFTVTNQPSPAAELWWQVDGLGWNQATIAATVTLTIPSVVSAYQGHVIEFEIKSTTETANRWTNSGTWTGVDFTGLTLDTGATVTLPTMAPKTVCMFGDSITEGVRTLNDTSTNDTDRNDGQTSYDEQMAPYLNANIVNIGFGGQGWTVTGSGSVPALPSSWNLIYSGVSRSLSGCSLVAVNMGTNDGATNSTSAVTSFLNGVGAAYSGTILLLEPFSSTIGPEQLPFLTAGAAASTYAARVGVLSTAGLFNATYSSDSMHSYGFQNIATLGPATAALLLPFLNTGGLYGAVLP